MAEQAFFTSAKHGLANFSGFQFVAVSHGLTQADQAVIEPYLTYARPPGAPAYPGPDEFAEFPVAFGYAPVGTRTCLTRCRYAGPDYSGRAGNFFAMAVLADTSELDYARPVELWGASWWSDQVPLGSPTDELPAVTSLAPGDSVSPELIARTVARRNRSVLAGLIDAVQDILDGASPSVVIIAEDVATVVTWIAAATCSLPFDQAKSISFVTYSGEPDRARYQLVGTTPATWAGTPRRQPAFPVDDEDWEPRQRPSRYALAVTDCWQQVALDELDEFVALASEVVTCTAATDPRQARQDRETTTALFQLATRRPADVAPDVLADLVHRARPVLGTMFWRRFAEPRDLSTEVALVLADAAAAAGCAAVAARILTDAVRTAMGDPSRRRHLRPLRWADEHTGALANAVREGVAAASTLDDLGERLGVAELYRVEVADTTVRERAAALVTPGTADVVAAAGRTARHRQSLLGGVIDGLESASTGVREAVLTTAACDFLEPLVPPTRPRVLRAIAIDQGRRSTELRLASTRKLADMRRLGTLASAELASDLAELWPQPSASDVHHLLDDKAGKLAPAEIAGLAVGVWRRGGVNSGLARSLAGRVHGLRLDRLTVPAAADAELVVLLSTRLQDLTTVTGAATRILNLDRHATPDIHRHVTHLWLADFNRIRPRRREQPGLHARDLLDRIASGRPDAGTASADAEAARYLLDLYWRDDQDRGRGR